MLAFRVCFGLHRLEDKLLSAVQAAASNDKNYEEEVHEQDEMQVCRANLVALRNGRSLSCDTIGLVHAVLVGNLLNCERR